MDNFSQHRKFQKLEITREGQRHSVKYKMTVIICWLTIALNARIGAVRGHTVTNTVDNITDKISSAAYSNDVRETRTSIFALSARMTSLQLSVNSSL